ncbi:Uncharacterized protein FKW44_003733 [Caligus rogercresseyi]|uniref:Uncharacterized protein n=1 Tax=Caligus rogercresseyi TaxID=217165 RepID=A0A7T8KM21_CALRO|nr:Uncharacterized protein FKW44_003733 [Caligus rogercresseyi]
MSLAFVASSGLTIPLIWFPDSIEDQAVALGRGQLPGRQRGLQTRLGTCPHLQGDPGSFWPPYSPDANSLDFTFWAHAERKACRVHHPNVKTLKASVNKHWHAMSEEMIVNGCHAFRRRIAAIIAKKGGRIKD